MPLLSDLYNISSKGNLRGKAKESFVRPTVCQFFSGKCNYGETQSTIDFASAPNFTRSTQFTGAVGEDVIKVNDNMGVKPNDQPGKYTWDGINTGGCSSGWYCPTLSELEVLYLNISSINSVADSNFQPTIYWSSTEAAVTTAYGINFDNGSDSSGPKYIEFLVRCVRSF